MHLENRDLRIWYDSFQNKATIKMKTSPQRFQ